MPILYVMERKSLTLRLNQEIYRALSSLSKVAHKSMNQMVTDAISRFIIEESRQVENDLEKQLAQIREYIRKDPDFNKAINAFADAELQCDDPAEGKVIKTSNENQSAIREILSGA